MSNIEDYIQKSLESRDVQQWEKLNELLSAPSRTKVKVNFFGKRVVKVEGFKDSISIDEIANKISKKTFELSKAGNLTDSNKTAGRNAVNLVHDFYLWTDSKIEKRNWFTQLANSIREFSLSPYTERFHVADRNGETRWYLGMEGGE